MNHSLSLIACLGIGIVIGVFLEKQYHIDLAFTAHGQREGNSAQKSSGGMYNKSGSYQDQSKSGKGKGLTEEARTGNVE